jgi:ATP-binding cassette subfamily F protein 3
VLSRQRRTPDSAGTVPASSNAPPAVDRKVQKRAEAKARQESYAQRKPLAEKLAQLEVEINALTAQKQALEATLASPDAYADANRAALRETLARQGDVTWRLARLEAEWLQTSEALDELTADAP